MTIFNILLSLLVGIYSNNKDLLIGKWTFSTTYVVEIEQSKVEKHSSGFIAFNKDGTYICEKSGKLLITSQENITSVIKINNLKTSGNWNLVGKDDEYISFQTIDNNSLEKTKEGLINSGFFPKEHIDYISSSNISSLYGGDSSIEKIVLLGSKSLELEYKNTNIYRGKIIFSKIK
jgi:hypothetical protein